MRDARKDVLTTSEKHLIQVATSPPYGRLYPCAATRPGTSRKRSTMSTTASEATVKRLTGALSRHDVGDLLPALMTQVEAGLSQTAASAMIQLVEALPLTENAAAAKANKVTEVGYYRHPADGRTVKVQRSKKGYLYALELDGPKPRFVSGLVSELDATQVAEKPAPVVAAESASTAALNDLLSQLSARTSA